MWKLVHGVFRKGKPRPPTKVEKPPAPPPPPKPPVEKGLSAKQIQELIAGENQEIKELLKKLLEKEQTVILSNTPGESQEKDNNFKAIEIDESIANVIEQEELEGQVSIQEETTEDDTTSHAEKLKQLLHKES